MQVLKSPTRWSEVVPGSRRGGLLLSLAAHSKEGGEAGEEKAEGRPAQARQGGSCALGSSGTEEAHREQAGSLMGGMCALPLSATAGLGPWEALEKDREMHSCARSSGHPRVAQQIWVGLSGGTGLCAAKEFPWLGKGKLTHISIPFHGVMQTVITPL